MLRISPQEVAKVVAQTVEPLDAPVTIVTRISMALQSNFSILDPDSADEQAEELLSPVSAELCTLASQASSDGVTCPFEVFGSCSEYVRGSSFIDPMHTVREREVRTRRVFVEEIQDCLKDLDWREFEIAATEILRRLGCKDPHTSPRRDDGGLDFYGRLELEGRLDDLLPLGGIDRRLHLWLIGQAKHYPTGEVKPAEIRELVGSVELARTRGAIHEWVGLDFRSFDPVCQLFFTTGAFSKGARELLAQSGIVAMNGSQLSTFLADCGVGIDSSGFDGGRFRTDLGL